MKKYLWLLLFLFVIGCQRTELSLNTFIEIADFNGYVVEGDKSGYEEYDYIKEIYYAVNREKAYMIQFLEIKDENYAEEFFNVNMEDLKSYEDRNSYIKKYLRNHTSLYHLETEENYLFVSRLKNNIIYVKAPINYINEIEEFFAELEIDY